MDDARGTGRAARSVCQGIGAAAAGPRDPGTAISGCTIVRSTAMSRILAVWEMGAHMGHIDRLLVCARALRARGHEVRFLLRDVSRAHGRLGREGFRFGQAPIWLPRLANPPRLNNFAAVVAAAGWLDPPGLAALLRAWEDAIDLAQPDLLLADHAPTALLAVRGRPLPAWSVGNSFELPPLGEAFPSLSPDDRADAARCAGYDATVLAPANEALALLGRPPLARLTDIFRPVQRVLATLPELAHYDPASYEPEVDWAGPSYIGDAGVEPQWPAGDGPRVFVYLTPTHPGFRPVIDALAALGARALVHAKGLSREAAARLGGPTMRFEAQPVQVDPTVAGADLVVSHASLGTVTAAALAGRPQLVLPSHQEQALVARRVVQAGIGLALPPMADGPLPGGAAPPQPLPLLRRLLAEPGFRGAAARLAERRGGVRPADTGRRVAERIEAALAAR